MKVLIICDHYPMSPRVLKIRDSILKENLNAQVKVIAWNRNNLIVKEDFVVTLNQDIGFGNQLLKLLNLYKFYLEIKKEIKIYRPDYIHAIDFEMLLIAALTRHNSEYIYEIYDVKFFNNKILNTIREKSEFYLIHKYVEKIIFASPFFEEYYRLDAEKKSIVLNNKPSKNYLQNESTLYMHPYKELLKNKIVIGFIGTVRYENILLNLLKVTQKYKEIVVLIAGEGPSYENILSYVKENELTSKVILTGRFKSEDLKEIYDVCDYIWAAYPNKDLNVRYAVSNKFFESIVFNKPIIVSNSTLLGEEVEKLDIGYTLNPYSLESIEITIKKINEVTQKIFKFKENILGKGLFWEDEEERIKDIY